MLIYPRIMFMPAITLLSAVLTCLTFASAAPGHHLMHPLQDRDTVGEMQSSGKMVFAHFIVRLSHQHYDQSLGSCRITL